MSETISFQPSADEGQALERAARTLGVDLEYWDIWGKQHPVRPEVLIAILESLGVPCDSAAAIDKYLEARLWEEWSRPLPPVQVLSRSTAVLEVSVPADMAGDRVRFEYRWESGQGESAEISLDQIPESGSALLRGKRFIRKRLEIPASAPLGYHEVRFATPFLQQSARLIMCPDRSHLPFSGSRRMAGFNVSLYALQSSRNWGCGDFADLCEITKWAREKLGVDFVALNPLHAIANRQPYNISPYLPECALYRNPIYLDLEQVPEFASSVPGQEWLRSEAVQQKLAELRESPLVEYEKVYQLKRTALTYAFRGLLRDYRAGGARSKQFRDFLAAEGEPLARYATFAALGEYLRKFGSDLWLFPDWPDDYGNPSSETVRKFSRKHRIRVMFHQYLQWLIDEQLSKAQTYAKSTGMRIGLYHDLALATDRYGADLWSYGNLYVNGCRVGSPPDDFAPEGQDWSFPPPNTDAIRAHGYGRFVETIRKTARHGGALRLDHVMRLFRLFWIPEGYEARDGAYVKDYAADLLSLLALESVRGGIVIVGEDLGTVSDEMRQGLAARGILSYRLFFFEREWGGTFKRCENYPQQAVVSTTTHDLPTLAGFWNGRDIHVRRETGRLPDEQMYVQQLEQRMSDKVLMADVLAQQGFLSAAQSDAAAKAEFLPSSIRDAILAFLSSTPAHLFLVNFEDLTLSLHQQNVPGTTQEYPNWQQKMAWTVEQIWEDEKPLGVAAKVHAILVETGRANALDSR